MSGAMLNLDEARMMLSDIAEALPPVELTLADALGCRIARSPVSDVSLPPSHVSAMDGYAVRHDDLEPGVSLPVAFEITAGKVPEPLPTGAATRIFTGAVLPDGADTVIPQELATVADDGRVLLERLELGAHVRRRSEVLSAGQTLAAEGDLVTPQRMALLAAGGAHRLQVVPRPSVAVVVTGSELVPPSAVPGPGQIRNTNGPLLDGLVRACGLASPAQLAAVDSERELVEALRSALSSADLVLTSGGVSVGDYDLVPDAVRSLGGEVVFHRVAVKPGKPVLAARVGRRWLLGLPGNPVSVLVSWWLFGRPLAAALAGDRGGFVDGWITAGLEEAVEVRGGRVEVRPAVLAAGPRVRAISWKGSHDLAAAAAANALVRLDARREYRAGEEVTCIPI